MSERVTIYRKRDLFRLTDPATWDVRLSSCRTLSRLAALTLPAVITEPMRMFSPEEWAEMYEEDSVRREDLPLVMIHGR